MFYFILKMEYFCGLKQKFNLEKRCIYRFENPLIHFGNGIITHFLNIDNVRIYVFLKN